MKRWSYAKKGLKLMLFMCFNVKDLFDGFVIMCLYNFDYLQRNSSAKYFVVFTVKYGYNPLKPLKPFETCEKAIKLKSLETFVFFFN